MQLGRLQSTALLVALATVTLSAQTYIWTGIGTGWQEQLTPSNDGTADLYIRSGLREVITLPGNYSINSLVFAGETKFYIQRSSTGAPNPLVITIDGGISSVNQLDSSLGSSRFDLAADIDVNVAAPQTFDINRNTLVLRGHLTGASDITLRATQDGEGNGTFIFNDSGMGNSGFSGNMVLDLASTSTTVAFWNGSPFGTGTVSVVNGGALTAHGTQIITNSLTLNTGGSTTNLALRSWDAPLTFSGATTLANNVTLQPLLSPAFVEYADGTGVLAQPGASTRQPIIFTGAIGESGGARKLTIAGQGLVILNPTTASSYTGGTFVGTSAAGSVVFGNNNAFPATGTVSVAQTNSYAGIGDLSAGNFAAMLNAHFDKTTAGAIGVDTLPGNATVTFSEAINLSSTGTGALNFTNSSLRLGTATSAILTGALTPQGTNYLFGNGGGSLYVQSSLGDTAGNGVTASRNVTNNSPGTYPPLKLYLQGVNSYSGGTTATGGFIIFDGIVALPATGALVTSGSSTSVGNGYIGTTFVELSATFLSRFTAASNWGIIGFDTHEGSGTTTANGVDLTGFNDGVFLGTATSAILSGTLTPSTLTNANNAANTLRLTAGNGGALTVNSTLADGSSALALMLGTPITANTSFSNGIVTLNGISTYTGGTTLNANSQGLTVVLGNNAALGSGTLTVTAPNGGLAGLAAATPGLNIPNAIALTGTSGQLHLMGDNSFTLSGTISGTGTLQFQRATTGSPFAVTLAGDNAALDGFLNLQHGTLTLAHDRAAGLATLNFFDATSVVAMTTTAPVIHGIDTDSDFGTITLTAGANLTIDVSDDTKNHNFGGSILSAAGGAINASVTIDGVNSASADFVYLAGSNQYTGGTTLINRGNLALGSNQSAGTGTITLNSVGSELALNSGVTLTNPIVLTQGGLSGFGVYAPSSFNGVPGGPITIGANQFLSPGFTRISDVPVGTLTLTPNTVFQDGGLMEWGLQDASRTDGSSVLAISGSLDLSSLSAGGFILYLTSFDATGATGLAPLTFGNTYSFSILTAAGGITGFNAANFTIDASSFQNGTMPDSAFSLLQSGNSLVLNFTAVPEPSTWALLTIGAFVLGVTAWRRRAVRP